MDHHIRKLNTMIRNKENELNELFTIIQKIGKRDCHIKSQKISSEKIGNSRNVINRRP